MSRLPQLGPYFDDFVRASSADLLRLAVLLTGDHGQAEDLLQVSLVRTATHWRSARQHPSAYTRRVLVNLAKNRWRDRARRPHEAQDLTGVEREQSSAEYGVVARDDMFGLVRQLPLEQRKVLVLRYFEDLTVAEVAAILRCSQGTVKSRSYRALATLRNLIAAQDGHTQEEKQDAH